MRFLVVACFLGALALAVPRHAAAAELVADLSNSLVAITTGFTGTEVLLFGTIDGSGEVVVVVHGPRTDKVVRRKERVAGIWVNRAGMVFRDVPGLYALASTAPIADVVSPGAAARLEIGAENLRVLPPEGAELQQVTEFKSALIRSMENASLFTARPEPIRFLGPRRLFRTDLRVPASAPTGIYTVSVYLFRDGDVVGAEVTPLFVSKIGFEARVFDFAHNYPVAYGVLAILIAGVAGWLASVVFRKG